MKVRLRTRQAASGCGDKAFQPPHLGPGDLLAESIAGIVQRPARSVLTLVGTVLGIGTFVAIVGLAQSTNAQISKQFNVLDATQVTVTDVGDTSANRSYDFPRDADERIARLRGVISAGVWWQVTTPAVSALPGAAGVTNFNLYALTPGALAASGATLLEGAGFTDFEQAERLKVAILSNVVASQLGITSLSNDPAVFIDGVPFAVIGIIGSDLRLPQFGLGIMIPGSTALSVWGAPAPTAPAAMMIHTRLGAANVIAAQSPVALRPDHQSLFAASSGLSPSGLRNSVSANLNTLLLVLAAVSLVIGAVGIANITLVAILERRGEIGLRRALGARRHHIALQFITESMVLGLLGGLIGAAAGVVAVLGVVIDRNWTAVITPGIVAAAPVAGVAVGLIAGLYPSIRASSIEPAEALRR